MSCLSHEGVETPWSALNGLRLSLYQAGSNCLPRCSFELFCSTKVYPKTKPSESLKQLCWLLLMCVNRSCCLMNYVLAFHTGFAGAWTLARCPVQFLPVIHSENFKAFIPDNGGLSPSCNIIRRQGVLVTTSPSDALALVGRMVMVVAALPVISRIFALLL